MTLAKDRPALDFLPQVRSFGAHRDRVTGIDHVFAGQDPRGIFRGSYDPGVAGRIRWADTPELGIAGIDTRSSPGLTGRLRVTSFAECDGRLYAAVGHQIYERIDGTSPRWRLVYANPHPFRDMTAYRDVLLIGLEAFIAPGSPMPDDHRAIDLGYGRVDADAWYLVRDPSGRYALHRIAVAERGAGTPRVATRTILVSPFPGDAVIYFGGYDANKTEAHDTAWIARGKIATVVGASPAGRLVRWDLMEGMAWNATRNIER